MWEESFMQWMESVHSHGLDTVMTVIMYYDACSSSYSYNHMCQMS